MAASLQTSNPHPLRHADSVFSADDCAQQLVVLLMGGVVPHLAGLVSSQHQDTHHPETNTIYIFYDAYNRYVTG